MKKIFTLLLTLLFTVSIVKADDISADKALVIASQFATASQPSVSKTRGGHAIRQAFQPTMAHVMRSATTGKDNVYVVNLGDDQGFVVIAGEDGTEDEVLGYCDHGSFTYDNCPIQFKDLLSVYSAGVDSLRQSPSTTTRARTRAAQNIGTVIIEPLLSTAWYQSAPYNKYCPEGCPTGCYPTAIAQVMNYWKWPRHSTGKVGDEDFSGHVYDWDNMIDDYDRTSYSVEQADAVAKLMADIGTAFGTRYAPGGSPTDFVSEPLVKNFSYNADITTHSASFASALKDFIIQDLNLKRPVLYCGSQIVGDAHALVCDGYTSDNYFHFNYGWGGSCDGFYKLSFLGYILDAWCFTGVRPYDSEIHVIDGIEYGLLQDGTAEILNYAAGEYGKDNGDLVIPSTITDEAGNIYRVTRIKKDAFYRKGSFGKVTLGDNIEVIEPYTFMYSTIDEVVLSDKMEVVPDQAFQLTGVKKLTIGSSVKRIGKQAFAFCKLSEVISKSPAFEADEEAFFNCGSVDQGEWLGCVTKLGAQAFAMAKFKETPNFTNLVEIGSQAFASCTFEKEEFAIPPKLKSISPDAFWGCRLSFFKVENNPNFLCSPYIQEYLCNSNGTSLIMTVTYQRLGADLPESIVRLEPGSIRAEINIIPATVVEMEGAFRDVESLSRLTCLAVTPPVISDATFNDKIFENDPDAMLRVPKGTGDLYRHAPGWRRFPQIVDDQVYDPQPAQGIQYYMVIEGVDNNNKRLSIPISDVADMHIDETTGKLVVKRNGKEDLVTNIASVDGITWIPGFLYEDAEFFDINENNLTAEAQKCKVRFDPTVIDGDVQLCVRNSVLTPNVIDGVVGGFAIDLSLSDGTHDLTGTVDITIPVENTNKDYCAAYFNEESGEWDPVYYEYDKSAGTLTISTNHLSTYGFFEVYDELTTKGIIQPIKAPQTLQPLGEAARRLLEVVSSDDPEWEMRWQVRNDISTWQSIGLDVIYNGANGLIQKGLGYKPIAQEIENAVEAMGYLATALNVVDVAIADLRGDDVGVASGTLKTILGHYGGVVTGLIDMPLFTASMATVAAIGIVLDKFGTMVQKRKIDLYREAYRLYYSRESEAIVAGTSKYGKHWYRKPKDWFELFYTAFSKPNKKQIQLDSYIEAEVRDYCDRFWGDTDAQAMCVAEAKTQGLSSWFYPDENTRKTISDEFFAELMNGQLVSVINSVRNHVLIDAFNMYSSRARSFANLMNTKIELHIQDKSCKEDEQSKYANYTIRFTHIPKLLADPENLQGTLNEQGRANMEFTHYSLIVNDIPTRLTLFDPKGKEVADYPFNITNKKGKQIIDIDLSTGGVEVENPHLEGLELTYDPDCIEYIDPDYRDNSTEWSVWPYTRIYLDKSRNKMRTRFETEIEKFFFKHDFITVDALGHIKIGNDIVGEFENNGNEGKGQFIIDTHYFFSEQTMSQAIKKWNNWANDREDPDIPFNGTIDHKITCQFVITRSSPESNEYDITYTGEGTYALQATVIKCINNCDYDKIFAHETLDNKPEDVETVEISAEGEVQLKYSTKLIGGTIDPL
jgi:hypothetical protein